MKMVRLHPVRFLKSVLLVIVILFVLLNLQVLFSINPGMQDGQYSSLAQVHQHYRNAAEMHVQSAEDFAASAQAIVSLNNSLQILPSKRQPINSTWVHLHPIIDANNRTLLKFVIDRINSVQYITNVDKFGLELNKESVVLLIQVHDRAEYLQILINSLRRLRGIEKMLVIVSHDVYSENLNRVIESVDFCPIMQIFHPVSMQLYPNVFPGEDPNDCPRNAKKEEALKLSCNNALHPDKYGHYREVRYCQTKHHWTWKLTHVFEYVKVLENYEGLMLLLEEDYYLAEDSIVILQMLNHYRNKECPDCQVLTLGNYDKQQNYQLNSRTVEQSNWISSKHNLGMAFTSRLWREIKACLKVFCDYDDYNWDWTLQYIGMKCIPQNIKVLKMKASRVIHMGDCGLHQKGKECHPQDKRKQVEKQFEDNKQYLFPNVLEKGPPGTMKQRVPKANGGWGDVRDHQLCYSFINGSWHR